MKVTFLVFMIYIKRNQKRHRYRDCWENL